MAVEVSRFAAMAMLPHGFAVLGRWTSLRWGAPLTPRAMLEKKAPREIILTYFKKKKEKKANAPRHRMGRRLRCKRQEDRGTGQDGLGTGEHRSM
jgi:hypothetical protein